jgi:hypothetical protein
VIYAIRAVGTQYVKVGYAKEKDEQDPLRVIGTRLATLQIGCPMALKLIAWSFGSIKEERALHRQLKRFGAHIRGEWFDANHKAVDAVIWALRDGQVNPKEIDWQPVAVRNTHKRLGAALSVRYAQLARDNPNGPTSPAGTAEALQPNQSPA